MAYRTPDNPGYIGGLVWQPLAAGIALFLLAHLAATELLAWAALRTGHYFAPAILHIGALGFYQPFAWIAWEYHFWRWLLFPHPPFTLALRGALTIGIVGTLLARHTPRIVTNFRTRHYSKKQEDLYGSSRWAQRKDLQEAGLLKRSSGILLGLWRGQHLYDQSDRHVLLCAATRTGKTATAVVGTLFSWPGSAIVLDVKEELYCATAGFRQRKGHICLKFSPLERQGCTRCNPLDFVRLGTAHEVSDVQKLAEAIGNPGNEDPRSQHWNDTSISLIVGVILHELYKKFNETGERATLKDISLGLSPFDTDFSGYLKEMSHYEHDPAGIYGFIDRDRRPTKTHPVVHEKAKEALNRSSDEAGSVLSTAKKRFSLFVDPLINHATAASDFTIEELVDREKPVTLYLVVPPSDKERLSPILRVIFSTVLSRLTEKRERHTHELLLLIDEFPTLGYLKPLEPALSFCGSYGIRCFLIVQEYGQILKHYGPYNEIISNCQIRITFAASELATAKMLSEMMGPRTLQHLTYNVSGPPQILSNGKGLSMHVQNTKRDLMEPAEIMRLQLPTKVGRNVVAPGESIILIFGCQPIKALQAFCHLDPTMSRWLNMPPVDQSRELTDIVTV